MQPFKEVERPSQHPDDAARRIFWSSDGELFVWMNESGDSVQGFQLCIRHDGAEHSLTQRSGAEMRIEQVDPGEDSPLKNRTPISAGDSELSVRVFLSSFQSMAKSIDPVIYALVSDRLRAACGEG